MVEVVAQSQLLQVDEEVDGGQWGIALHARVQQGVAGVAGGGGVIFIAGWTGWRRRGRAIALARGSHRNNNNNCRQRWKCERRAGGRECVQAGWKTRRSECHSAQSKRGWLHEQGKKMCNVHMWRVRAKGVRADQGVGHQNNQCIQQTTRMPRGEDTSQSTRQIEVYERS